mmetsp:Transcript_53976/g.154993  ORF Transcript_53976/g.154993 Transcript_53976/m.154993 type:complete len:101 (-) Transcript_53976:99-401(-)
MSSNCWWVPCSTTVPLCSTKMQSADLTVDNRCAMTKVVAFLALISFSRAACTWLSFALSKALVASSSNSTFGSRMTARAIATLCFCPPEMRAALSPGFES